MEKLQIAEQLAQLKNAYKKKQRKLVKSEKLAAAREHVKDKIKKLANNELVTQDKHTSNIEQKKPVVSFAPTCCNLEEKVVSEVDHATQDMESNSQYLTTSNSDTQSQSSDTSGPRTRRSSRRKFRKKPTTQFENFSFSEEEKVSRKTEHNTPHQSQNVVHFSLPDADFAALKLEKSYERLRQSQNSDESSMKTKHLEYSSNEINGCGQTYEHDNSNNTPCENSITKTIHPEHRVMNRVMNIQPEPVLLSESSLSAIQEEPVLLSKNSPLQAEPILQNKSSSQEINQKPQMSDNTVFTCNELSAGIAEQCISTQCKQGIEIQICDYFKTKHHIKDIISITLCSDIHFVVGHDSTSLLIWEQDPNDSWMLVVTKDIKKILSTDDGIEKLYPVECQDAVCLVVTSTLHSVKLLKHTSSKDSMNICMLWEANERVIISTHCIPLNEREICVSMVTTQQTTIRKYILDKDQSNMETWLSFDPLDRPIKSLSQVDNNKSCLLGFGDDFIAFWNESSGNLLKVINLHDGQFSDFLCVKAVDEQGILFVILMHLNIETPIPGCIMAVNPANERLCVMNKVHLTQQMSSPIYMDVNKTDESSDRPMKVHLTKCIIGDDNILAVAADGKVYVWDMFSGDFYAESSLNKLYAKATCLTNTYNGLLLAGVTEDDHTCVKLIKFLNCV